MNKVIEVDLWDLEIGYQAVNGSSEEISVYVSKVTGKVIWDSEEHSDKPAPDLDMDEDDDYVHLPDKYDLDLGKVLVMKFAETVPELYDEIRNIFSSRGAYRKFRDLLGRNDIVDKWLNFESEGEKRALLSWCDQNGFKGVVTSR